MWAAILNVLAILSRTVRMQGLVPSVSTGVFPQFIRDGTQRCVSLDRITRASLCLAVSPCLSLSDFELESSPHGRWLKICRFLESPLSWWRSNRSNGRTRTPRSHSCDKRFRQRSARATSVVAKRLSRTEQWREWVTKYRVYVGSDFDCNRIFDASEEKNHRSRGILIVLGRTFFGSMTHCALHKQVEWAGLLASDNGVWQKHETEDERTHLVDWVEDEPGAQHFKAS